ncbi:uncharacterized protein LOC106670219 [Cimex lectularius]|uniref:Uncharacterized protein n=1 Tax=Cimex lectularius TaxID=79782 RepID=A0A8I6TJJ3_CIMLE|nr:uncharacterized protein LOC106670219 [Cimex lectularius]
MARKHNNGKCELHEMSNLNNSYPPVLTGNNQHYLNKQKDRSVKNTVNKMSSNLNNYTKRKMDDSGCIEAKTPNLNDLSGKACTHPKGVMAMCDRHCSASILEETDAGIEKLKNVYSRLVTRVQNLTISKESGNFGMTSSVERLNDLLKQLNKDKDQNLDVLRSFLQGINSLWLEYKREKKEQRKKMANKKDKNGNAHTATDIMRKEQIPSQKIDSGRYSKNRTSNNSCQKSTNVPRSEHQSNSTTQKMGHTEATEKTCPDSTKLSQNKLLDKKRKRIPTGRNSNHQTRQQNQSREAQAINKTVQTHKLMNPVKEHDGLSQVRDKLTETIAIINAVQSNFIQSNRKYLPPIRRKDTSCPENHVKNANYDSSSEQLCDTEKLNMTETSVEKRYQQVRTNLFLTDRESKPSKKVNYVKHDGKYLCQSETSTATLHEIETFVKNEELSDDKPQISSKRLLLNEDTKCVQGLNASFDSKNNPTHQGLFQIPSNTFRTFGQEEEAIIVADLVEQDQQCDRSALTKLGTDSGESPLENISEQSHNNILTACESKEIREADLKIIPQYQTLPKNVSNQVNHIDRTARYDSSEKDSFDSDGTLPSVVPVYSPRQFNTAQTRGIKTKSTIGNYKDQDKCDSWLQINEKQQVSNLELLENCRNDQRGTMELSYAAREKELVTMNIDAHESCQRKSTNHIDLDHLHSCQVTRGYYSPTIASTDVELDLLKMSFLTTAATSNLTQKCLKHRSDQDVQHHSLCNSKNKATQYEGASNCKEWGTLYHTSVQTVSLEPTSKCDRLVQTEEVTLVSQNSQTVLKQPPRRFTSHVFVTVDLTGGKTRGRPLAKCRKNFIKGRMKMAQVKRTEHFPTRTKGSDIINIHEEKSTANAELCLLTLELRNGDPEASKAQEEFLENKEQLSLIRIYQPSKSAARDTYLTDILSNQPREFPNFHQEDDKLGSVSTPALFRFKSRSVPTVISRSGMKEECMKAKSALEFGHKANIFEIGSKPSRLPISLPSATDDYCLLNILRSPFSLTSQGGDFIDNKLKTEPQEEQLAKMQGTGSPGLSRRVARKRKWSGTSSRNISANERSYTRSPPTGNRKKALRKQSKTSSHLETPNSLSKDGHSSSSVKSVKNNYLLEKNKTRHENMVDRVQTEKIQKSKSEPSLFWNKMNLQCKHHEENLRISKSEQDFPLGTEILGHLGHTQLSPQENKKTPHSTVSSLSCNTRPYSQSVSIESEADDFTQVDSTSSDNDRNIVMDNDTERTASLNIKINEDTVSYDPSSIKISLAQPRISRPDRESTPQHQLLKSSLPGHDDSMKEIMKVTGLKKIQQLKMPLKIGAENAEIIIYYSKKGSTINDSTGHEKKDILLSETIGSFKDMLNWMFQSVFSPTSEEHPTQTISTPKGNDTINFTPKTEPVHVFQFKATPATCNRLE